MCARFGVTSDAQRIESLFGIELGEATLFRVNIAPQTPVCAVTVEHGRRLPRWLQWGFVPSWSKDLEIGKRLINARAETVDEKPSFRGSFRHRRCVVPADVFYEWRAGETPKDRKQPFAFRRADGTMLALAGLWDHWQSPDGSEFESLVILTTAANEDMASVHERMPVIIEPSELSIWLDPAADRRELAVLLAPSPEGTLERWPISTRINNPRAEGADLLLPLELA